MHDFYFEPKHGEFKPKTIWSLSNAFPSAFKDLDQFKATAKLGEFLESQFFQAFWRLWRYSQLSACGQQHSRRLAPQICGLRVPWPSETRFVSENNNLHSVSKLQLHQNVLYVCSYSGFFDAERCSDFSV